MNKKSQLGQFYTTKATYIIGNLLNDIPNNVDIIEPFVGNGDLLIFDNYSSLEMYDIDPKMGNTIKQDTLLNPPIYDNKYVITNPPYLYRNKAKDKTIYDKYDTTDLYKAFIKSILNCDGGILIIPLNFLCDNDDKIRNLFFEKFQIINLNIFEEQIFDDTTYNICSFSFRRRIDESNILKCKFHPSNIKKEFSLHKETGYKIGHNFLKIIKEQKNIGISRLTIGGTPNSNLYIRCIDTGSDDGRIKLSLEDHFYGKETDRTFATIILDKEYSIEDQKFIAEKFNHIIENQRNLYHSLFLSNYRNSTKAGSRKRISFDTTYKLISFIIEKYL